MPISKRWSICHRLTTAAAALAALLLPTSAFAESVLFVGNSFTFGASSPVWKYRAESVSDLNKGGVGGVPALFKTFAEQAGLDYSVSLETVGGTDLEFHLTQKAQRSTAAGTTSSFKATARSTRTGPAIRGGLFDPSTNWQECFAPGTRERPYG